jgi:DNA processing protein
MISCKKVRSLLHVFLLDGIGERTLFTLTKGYTFLVDFYEYSYEEFCTAGITEKKAKVIFDGLKNTSCIEECQKNLEKELIFFVTPFDTDYPLLLQDLEEEQPPFLFYQSSDGSFPLKQWIPLSFVSSRKTDSYGKKAIFNLVEELSLYSHSFSIISGGAIGGDTLVHEAALANDLPTIVCLGSGLSHWYPRSNTFLFKKIRDVGGLLVSQLPPFMPPRKELFPLRNKIVAALSYGTIVIQAGQKSGTLITVDCSLRLGREVGAVPHGIFESLGVAPNQLIRSGATPIVDAESIIEMLPKQYNFTKAPFSRENTLSLVEKKVLSYCQTEKALEEVASFLLLSREEAYSVLFSLLKKKMLSQNMLGNWIAERGYFLE